MDVPSGVWAMEEYEKLREYDRETAWQPPGPFHCHATPSHLCNGWVTVHTIRAATEGHRFDLLALRIFGMDGEVPEHDVMLWGSGNEAADHGEADLEAPSPAARAAVERLERKYPRLRQEA
jgi:hypothetical protein